MNVAQTLSRAIAVANRTLASEGLDARISRIEMSIKDYRKLRQDVEPILHSEAELKGPPKFMGVEIVLKPDKV